MAVVAGRTAVVPTLGEVLPETLVNRGSNAAPPLGALVNLVASGPDTTTVFGSSILGGPFGDNLINFPPSLG